MIIIKKYDNQSEKNRKHLSKNDLVSTDSSLKDLFEKEDDEDVYIGISDHSHTVSYDKLNENTETAADTQENDSKLDKIYKNAVKKENYAQIEQNLKNENEALDYIPPLQPKGEYNSSLSEASSLYTADSRNNDIVSSGSGSSSLVQSSAIYGKSDKSQETIHKSDYVKKLRKQRQRQQRSRADRNPSISVNERHTQAVISDRRINLEHSTSGAAELQSSFSKADSEKLLSKSVLPIAELPTVQQNKNRYRNIVKKKYLDDITSSTNSTSNIVDTANTYERENKTYPQAYQLQASTHSVYGTSSSTSANVYVHKRSPRINRAVKIAAYTVADHQRNNIQNTRVQERTKNKKSGVGKTSQKDTSSIKSQFSANCSKLITNSADRINNTGNQSLYTLVRNGSADLTDTPETNSVNSLFTVVEMGKNTQTGVAALINTVEGVIYVGKGIVYAGKLVKAMPQNIKKTKRFIKRLRKMSFKQKRKYAALKVKNKANAIKEAALKQVKAVIAAFMAVALSSLILVLFVGCLIGAIFASFTWQTSKPIDTTNLINYISQMDFEVQRYVRNNTKTQEQAIAEENDIYYYYYAYNKSDTEATYEFDENGKPTNIRGYVPVGYYDIMADELKRYSTQDYISALSYLQVKYGNLAWYQTIVGAIGEAVLKGYARDLHNLTHSVTTETYTYHPSEGHSVTHHYYFYRQYSVDYLVNNNILPLTQEDKEKYRYTCVYGNAASATLQYPLHEDYNIVGHKGYHINPNDGNMLMHSGIDLKCSSGDAIYSPISGWADTYTLDDGSIDIRVYTTKPNAINQNTKIVKISMAAATVINNPIIDGEKIYSYVNAGDLIGYAGDSGIYTLNSTDCLNDENHIHLEYTGYDESFNFIYFAPEAFLKYPEE